MIRKIKMAYAEELKRIFKDYEAYSTREIMKAIEKMRGKKVNWYMCYYGLSKMEETGRIEKIASKHTILWRKIKKKRE